MAPCARCGEENPDRAKFCLACGSPLEQEASETRQIRKVVTVLFSDVTGSTGLGERLDPEALRNVMNHYFDEMKNVVERYGGTVVDFIGDAVMAVFGIPTIHEDDALRACRAALEMKQVLPLLNDELERKWGIRIQTRTGLNSGVVSGEVAARRSMVLGDAVNVAARLEEMASPGEIFIGEETYRMARDALSVEPVEGLELKGKGQPVRTFRLESVVSDTLISGGRLSSGMVGRDRESLLLHQAFERSEAERACHLFTLMGPAGVGKSRLVHEFLLSIGHRATVLRGRCLAYGEGITFWPLAEAMDDAAGLTAADSPEEADRKIEALIGDDKDAGIVADRVGQLIGLRSGSASREESFWAVRKLFEVLARRRPLAVVFDDMHWAQPTFLDLVEHVADWSRDAPLVVVCMARPELLEVRPSWGGGKFNATSILMEPLDDDQCTRLIDALVGGEGLDESTKRRIADSAEGNPLFVEETLAMLIDDGVLEKTNGSWTASSDLSQLSVPPTIQALLAARLDRLSTEERPVIEAASIIGKVFARRSLHDLVPGDLQTEVGDHLMTMVRKQLVAPAPSTFEEDVFKFRHILIRDVAYEGIPKETRADLHERFAAWIEKSAGERLAEYEEILAYHLEQSCNLRSELMAFDDALVALSRRAAGHLAAAGRRALARDDVPAAVNLLTRATHVVPSEDAIALELAPELGAALTSAGQYPAAEEVVSGAVEKAEALGDERLRSYAALERSFLRVRTEPEGATEEARREAERARRVFERTNDQRGMARVLQLMADVHWGESHYAEVEKALHRGIGHARASGDERVEIGMLGTLAVTPLWGPTPVEEGLVQCRGILDVVRSNRRIECNTISTMACLEAMRANFDTARELLERARTISDEISTPYLIAGVAERGGVLEMLAGRPDAAELQYRRAFDFLKKVGEKSWLSTMGAALGGALYGQERYSEAESMVEEAERAAASDDIDAQIEWKRQKAKLLARKGRMEEGESLARSAMELVDRTDFLNMRGEVRL
ncbi:MAG: AAA family ATPase, partial [Actinomycetota bacterium]|nr:AAA family ATPase [Actinomycetota bacterium]